MDGFRDRMDSRYDRSADRQERTESRYDRMTQDRDTDNRFDVSGQDRDTENRYERATQDRSSESRYERPMMDRPVSRNSDRYDNNGYGGYQRRSYAPEPTVSAEDIAFAIDKSNKQQLGYIADLFGDARIDLQDSEQSIKDIISEYFDRAEQARERELEELKAREQERYERELADRQERDAREEERFAREREERLDREAREQEQYEAERAERARRAEEEDRRRAEKEEAEAKARAEREEAEARAREERQAKEDREREEREAREQERFERELAQKEERDAKTLARIEELFYINNNKNNGEEAEEGPRFSQETIDTLSRIERMVGQNAEVLDQDSEMLERNVASFRQNADTLAGIISSLEAVQSSQNELAKQLESQMNSNQYSYDSDEAATEELKDEIMTAINDNRALLNMLRQDVINMSVKADEAAAAATAGAAMGAAAGSAAEGAASSVVPLSAEDAEKMYKELEEHVHRENVKCYRNIQAAFTEQQQQEALDPDSIKKVVSPISLVTLVTLVVSLLSLGISVAQIFGIFS